MVGLAIFAFPLLFFAIWGLSLYFFQQPCPRCGSHWSLRYLRSRKDGGPDLRFNFNPVTCSSCGWDATKIVSKHTKVPNVLTFGEKAFIGKAAGFVTTALFVPLVLVFQNQLRNVPDEIYDPAPHVFEDGLTKPPPPKDPWKDKVVTIIPSDRRSPTQRKVDAAEDARLEMEAEKSRAVESKAEAARQAELERIAQEKAEREAKEVAENTRQAIAKNRSEAAQQAKEDARKAEQKAEQGATIKLKLIRSLLDDAQADRKKGNDIGAKDKTEVAQFRLKDLITKFPGTKVAEDAKKLLDSIK